MARIIEARPNRASADEAGSFIDKFEQMETEVASERGKFMSACRAIRQRQKELLDDAKSQGVSKSIVKAIVKARELEAKARDILADFEDTDEQTYAIDIRKALGDDFSTLPLGAAAVQREDTKETPKVDPAAAAAAAAWDAAAPKKSRPAKH